MRTDSSRLLEEREELTSQLADNPYSTHIYLQRALRHEWLGYPDLAASDAYRALLLTDEVLDEEGEHHEKVIEAYAATEEEAQGDSGGDSGDEEPPYANNAKVHALHSYKILARTLFACGDLKSAYDFTERGLKAFHGQEDLQMLQVNVLEEYSEGHLQKRPTFDNLGFNPRTDLPENGSARREIYPWNTYEPDRFSQHPLASINDEINEIAPKCEVRVTELPLLYKDASYKLSKFTKVRQLGIFATSDINPHELVLQEPSVLTSSTGLHDPLCDACSTRLPPFAPESPFPTCSMCEDVFFCSRACFDRAQYLYHPAVCGIVDFDVVAKDPSPFAATNALYTLLIARTMAMAETQGIHPLDLAQVRYLWGDYSHSDDTAEYALPFSFSNNIARPLHLLARLEKDPFVPENLDRYDTWVINTLLAKFRGTANAKMNERTGVPEVAGVHWLWCLANHSCAPNVRWEWEKGKMGFVARGENDAVRWGGKEDEGAANVKGKGGIKAGQEILNHYCDVKLPVKERREWAIGALGGICVCERCSWEEKEKGKGET